MEWQTVVVALILGSASAYLVYRGLRLFAGGPGGCGSCGGCSKADSKKAVDKPIVLIQSIRLQSKDAESQFNRN